MNWKEHLSSDPSVMFGKVIIKGTRIPAELILEKLAIGNTFGDLLQAYPKISIADIQACLWFAAASIKHERTLAIG